MRFFLSFGTKFTSPFVQVSQSPSPAGSLWRQTRESSEPWQDGVFRASPGERLGSQATIRLPKA